MKMTVSVSASAEDKMRDFLKKRFNLTNKRLYSEISSDEIVACEGYRLPGTVGAAPAVMSLKQFAKEIGWVVKEYSSSKDSESKTLVVSMRKRPSYVGEVAAGTIVKVSVSSALPFVIDLSVAQ